MVVEDVRGPGDAARPRPVEALEHVANRPIASHVLDALVAAGVDEVLVVTSDELAVEVLGCVESGGVSDGIRLRQVSCPAPLDLPAALELVAPIVGASRCIVHSADGLLDAPLAPFVDRIRGAAPDATGFVHHSAAANGHLNAATQEMLHLAEVDPHCTTLGIAGVWLFGPSALPRVATGPWHAAGEVDLTRVGEQIRGAGGTLELLPVETWRSYSGDPHDLLDLNRIALDNLQGELRRPYNNGNRIEGRVWIDECASVRDSVIVGPTVIGPGARISDAYIGPYTSIGARAQIEGAEIDRSIISAGASILHVSGRIVSSVVGRDARVFRDFSLPRALRLRVGDGTEIALW